MSRFATRRSSRASSAPGIPVGFSLVELMIALVIGLMVTGGAVNVFLANQQTYRANSALSDLQNGSRVAFELLARDLRGAGLSGCNSTSGRVANVLNPSSANWFADWANALHGYDDSTTDPALSALTGNGAPVAGTSSVHVLSTGSVSATVQIDNEPAAPFKLNETTTDLQSGDIVIVCDYDHAAIMQISNYNSNNATVVHNTGNSISPGNCSKGLGYPTTCTENGNIYSYPPNSQIAKLTGHVWYIGANPVGGRSLYLLNAVNNGGSVAVTPQEMVRNVTDMQITYDQPPATSFAKAANVTDWSVIASARVTLSVQSTDPRAGVNAKPIKRQYAATTTLRNRVQ